MTVTIIVIAALLVGACFGLWWDSRYQRPARRAKRRLDRRLEAQARHRRNAQLAHQINLQREKEKWENGDPKNN